MTYYNCPVCGYDQLDKPPNNFSVCACCGTEFEADDFDRTHSELRSEWIEKDMPWFSRSTLKPKNWNGYRQLIIADLGSALVEHPRMNGDVNFRHEVNKAFSEVRIAKQLKLLRERDQEPLTQAQLAARADMKQSRISELEGMNYSSWSISTLERLAKAMGVGFRYSFVRWSDLIREIEQGLTKDALVFPSFERESVAHGRVFTGRAQTITFYPVLQSGYSNVLAMLEAAESPSVKGTSSYAEIVGSIGTLRNPHPA